MNNPIIMDGAMGSELIKRGTILPRHTWSAHANLERPDLVKTIHQEYIDAGAQIITANTFRATPRSYKKTGLSMDLATQKAYSSLNKAVQLAKQVAKENTIILGSIAPLEDCYKPELFPGKKTAESEFKMIIKWLLDAKVDGIILETMNSLAETAAVLNILNDYHIPTYVSYYVKTAKQLPSHEPLSAAMSLLKNYEVTALLFNCSPIATMNKVIDNMIKNYDGPWGVYPNLGEGQPSPDGTINVISSNNAFLNFINKSINKGAKIIGACCGSSPNHIKLLNNKYNV